MQDVDKYLELVSQLFTGDQQFALFIITVSVMSLTQVFKKVFFAFMPRMSAKKTAGILTGYAFVIGVTCGAVGYYVAVPPQPLWFWLFCGASGGMVSIAVYKAVIDVIWPIVKPRLFK